jgi:hypothetical protein
MSAIIGDPVHGPPSAYEVILDPPIDLGVGRDIDQTFDFTLAQTVATDEPVIISFLLIRAYQLQLQVTMNDRSYIKGYSPGPERSVHEVIGPAALGGANQLTFQVHEGECRISDIIVWYKQYI